MKFRKRPVEIEAEQFCLASLLLNYPLPFATEDVVKFGCECDADACCSFCNRWWVNTLEGPLKVSDGDWIVRGIAGEFYPVKEAIFHQTYEPVAPDASC